MAATIDSKDTLTLSLRTSAQFLRKGARMNSMNIGAPKDTTLATFSCMAGMSANIMKARVPEKGIQGQWKVNTKLVGMTALSATHKIQLQQLAGW
jgi:hypothetical protein